MHRIFYVRSKNLRKPLRRFSMEVISIGEKERIVEMKVIEELHVISFGESLNL